MIKVLYLRSSFNPGGTETLLLNLFNYKQKAIQFFYVLLSDGTYIEKLDSETNTATLKFRKSKFDLSFIPFISKMIKKNEISIIHSHQLLELIYGIMIKVLNPGIKLFHTVHLYNDLNDWKFKLEKFLIRFTTKTIVVSKSLQSKLVNRGFKKDNLFVLYNAVILDNIDQNTLKENRRKFEKLIDYNADDFIIGMTGNFVPEKDQLTLVKAFNNAIKSKFKNVKLVLIGKTSENTQPCINEISKEEIGKKVFFTGALASANQYLDYFDLFVMSSKSETFGIVVIEALLKKVSVLASDIDTFVELSEHETYFPLFKAGDVQDLARKIEAAIGGQEKDTGDRNEVAFKYASTKFSYKKYMDELKNAYSN